MSAIQLKPFHEKAVADLRKQFLELWKTTNRELLLTFKAPTGSGKTIMELSDEKRNQRLLGKKEGKE